MSAVGTLTWRSLVQVRHNPMELIDLTIQPIIFLLLFTYVFGGAIAGSTAEYLTFALPGLIVQNSLFATMTTGIGIASDLHKGVYDRLLSLPISRAAPLSGRIVADTVKQAWAIALLLGLGAVLGFRITTGVPEALAAVALLLGFGLAVSWVAVLIGTVVEEPEKVQVFAFVVLMPLTFTSNAFVRTDTMPSWLKAWADVNPVSKLADAVRGLLNGGEVVEPLAWSLGWAALITAVFMPLAVRAVARRS